MKRMYWLKIFVFILGVMLFSQGIGLDVASAQELPGLEFKCKSKTSWTIPDYDKVRGIAFDGKYYYAGIYSEGLIRKYDLNGKLVDKTGRKDTPHPYPGHGVATDSQVSTTAPGPQVSEAVSPKKADKKYSPLPGKAPSISINSNGNITIDGKPFFPLGIYSSLGIDKYSGELTKGDLPMSEERTRGWFSGIKEAGFNMVQTYALCHYAQTDPSRLAPLEKRQEGRKLFLDYADRAGLKVMFWLHEGYADFRHLMSTHFPNDPLPAARKKAWEIRKKEIISSIEVLGEHPALLVWYLADELAPEHSKLLEAHYKFTKSLDTAHPMVVVNWKEDSIRSQSRACDIMGEDCYPIGARYGEAGGPHQPKGKWCKMSDIAEWQDWIRETQVNGRPVAWGVVQVHRKPGSSPTLRFPTFKEMRVMTFMRLVKDAKGLFFFNFNNDRVQPWMEILPSHWKSISKVVKSVHSVFPALFSSEIIKDYKVSDERVYSIMKKVKEGGNTYYYLITVNPTCEDIEPPEDHPVALGKITFSNIKARTGSTVTVLDEDEAGRFKLGTTRKIMLKGRDGSYTFTDNFGKLAVHVYKIGPL